jgi:acyl carrier protein
VKRFFRALIPGDSWNQPEATQHGNRDAEAARRPNPGTTRVGEEKHFTRAEILENLVAHICSTMPDPRTPEEIDDQIHMYDAGYLTSITAADLLAHIDTHYGLDISETQLIGPLQNLAALATYIESST